MQKYYYFVYTFNYVHDPHYRIDNGVCLKHPIEHIIDLEKSLIKSGYTLYNDLILTWWQEISEEEYLTWERSKDK